MDKIVITGTGRCGTSFLMHLFTNLGYNTGYSREEAETQIHRIENLRAGIEHGIGSQRMTNAFIVKNPDFANIRIFHDLISKYSVEHVIIPIRELENSAKSRELMAKTYGGYGGFIEGIENLEQQKQYNAELIYNFVHGLSMHDIPFTFIQFELMMGSSDYLYRMLTSIGRFCTIDKDRFGKIYEETIKPEYVRF